MDHAHFRPEETPEPNPTLIGRFLVWLVTPATTLTPFLYAVGLGAIGVCLLGFAIDVLR
jgi:hypothetical protein